MTDNKIDNIELENLRKENTVLKEKLEFHEHFMENSNNWETFRNVSGKIIYVSPNIEYILGISRNDYLNNKINIFDFIYPDDLALAKENFYKQISKQYLNNFICRVYDINKNLKFLSISSKPVYNSNNEYIGFRTSIIDITELKVSEQALKESEQSITSILNNITDIVWSVKMPEMTLDYVSPSIEKIYGYSPKEFFDNPNLLHEIIHPDDKPLLNERFQFLLANNYAIFERRNIHRNGKVVWILDKSQVIYNNNNEIVRIEGIAHDITELKEREFLIQQQNSELSKLNADKDRFIKILAHDLKNPFNSLLGFSNLLLENLHKYDIQKIENQLKIIHTTSHQTYELLEQILLWAKSQSGKLKLELQKFSYIEISNEIIKIIENQAIEKNIKIKVFENEKVIISADLNMYKAIMRNLISNAIKFTNQNGQINIYAENNHKNAIITVSDNGIGIDKNIIPKLWEINEHYSTTGTNNEKGTGFGLILCKELIEKHNGQIWVESEVGKGSDFKFSMPLCND